PRLRRPEHSDPVRRRRLQPPGRARRRRRGAGPPRARERRSARLRPAPVRGAGPGYRDGLPQRAGDGRPPAGGEEPPHELPLPGRPEPPAPRQPSRDRPGGWQRTLRAPHGAVPNLPLMPPAAPEVLAAGGLVWRPGEDGPEIAVVHRPKYDDWSLPKGKLDEGEDFEAAALREVQEETGLRGR